MKIAIIGGGAAGFFSAIQVKNNFPDAQVHIFEKSTKVLSKVKLSGGGRCNLSHNNISKKEWLAAYPRGKNLLKKTFRIFDHNDAMAWFEKKGIALVTQEDGCVFPQAQDSQVIIDLFLKETQQQHTSIHFSHEVIAAKVVDKQIALHFKNKDKLSLFDKVIVTTGGSPKRSSLDWIAHLGHDIATTLPSLFTFNIPNNALTKLMGLVVENAIISLQTTKLQSTGALLVTHWGMSGPAVLKLSSLAAPILYNSDYDFKVSVNWVGVQNTEFIKEELYGIIKTKPKRLLSNYRPYQLTERHWIFLLEKCSLSSEKRWLDIGKKAINLLANVLSNDIYSVKGKTTFREEFVTCGGVDLNSINAKTLESKHCPNLYFAGEVLDVDGITGGYNLQAAWSTAFVAAKLGS